MNSPKLIWIDLDNSPHVPFFIPIKEELERRGHTVFLTARDCFQVCGLADLFHLDYKRIGRHYGKNKVMKLLGTCYRSFQLMPEAWRRKPDLAVSHGSRAQVMAAKLLGIRTLVLFDYEFARFVPGFKPSFAMVPDVIPESATKYGGCPILKYPGIKEDVYVPRFKPDPSIKTELGLDDGRIIVTLRPPADEAHYHNPESEVLLKAVMEVLGGDERVKVILTPRNERQAAELRSQWPRLFETGKVVIPDHVVDGLNLIWHSDLVISGGGTMNREAAALGVPVYSIFRGPIGHVDHYLADNGRLVLLENAEDVRRKLMIERRGRQPFAKINPRPALTSITENIIRVVENGHDQ